MTHKHQVAIDLLKKMLKDAKKNRFEADPDERDKKWGGYIEGVEGSIYRLEMKG